MATITSAQLDKLISEIKETEKLTKSKVGTISRQLLTYVVLQGSDDIQIVNRFMAVLTPINKSHARLYFKHFLPFTEENGKFGKKVKGERKVAAKVAAIEEFLANKKNNLWSWCHENVAAPVVAKNYSAKLTKLVSNALADQEQGLNPTEVMLAIIEAGISIEDMLVMLDATAK